MNYLLARQITARRGFTLIELLVVISIIAILAGLLLPVLGRAKVMANINKAKTEINNILSAISKYEADYSRYPASKKARESINDGNCPDFTYGTLNLLQSGRPDPLTNKKGQPLVAPLEVKNTGNVPDYQNSNAEVMAALLDMERFRNNSLTWNLNHAMNPNKIPYLNAKEVSDTKSPGIGQDGVFRDPWGNPYIITLDLNGDNKCRDGFYRKDSVSGNPPGGSKGFNGLSNSSGVANAFEANKPIMVWSFGPDGRIDDKTPATKGVNKDNVLSW